MGHRDNRQLRCQNAGEGWLQPIFNPATLCKLQFQHFPNTPPAPKTLLVFLLLAGPDFLFHPLPVARGTQPCSTASLPGTRTTPGLPPAGFHPQIHSNKRVCREESHYNPKGCCVSLPIAVFCSVALSSTSLVSPVWDCVTSLPCFTHLFLFSFIVYQSRRKPGIFPSCFLQVLSSKLHHSTL